MTVLRRLRRSSTSATYEAILRTPSWDAEIVPKVSDPGPGVDWLRRETRALRDLSKLDGLPVPRMVFAGSMNDPHPGRVLATVRIEGANADVDTLANSPWGATVVVDRTRALAGTLARIHERARSLVEPGRPPRRIEHLGGPAAIDWPDDAAALATACAETLDETMPEPGEATLVHGDYRLGNALFANGGVAGIIDWEQWQVGDPRIDLGFLVASSEPLVVAPDGSDEHRRWTDRVVDDYARAAGRPIEHCDWFVALGHCQLARNRLRRGDGFVAKLAQAVQADPSLRGPLLAQRRRAEDEGGDPASREWRPRDHLRRALELIERHA